MLPRRSSSVLLCGLLALAPFARAQGATADAVAVTGRAGGMFTLSDRDGNAFVTQGHLDGVAATAPVREEAATDPVFGQGRRLVFTRNGADGTGGEITLETYPGLPFTLVRETVRNISDKPVDLQKVVPATFSLRLGKSAAELKTMGTGGLLAPDRNPGSYLFLTVADPETREGVVAGWVTQKKGSGTVFSSVKNGVVELRAQLEHGHLILKPGESATLDTFAVGRFADARLGEEALASAIAKAHAIRLRPKTAVYCSWYAEGPDHGGAGTARTTAELARFCAKEKLPAYGLGVLQIDDRWQAGPQIGGPATHFDRVNPDGPYKDGIAPVAKAVEEAGMTFGLWWLPFGRNHMEADYKGRQDWFWKWENGTPLRQRSFGGTCLDSSVPAVAGHLEALGRLLRSWGVKYYKMDGLNAGVGVDHCYINDGYKDDGFGRSAPAHDPSLTNVEVMRKGLAAIRRGAGDDVFFSGCCAVQNMRTYAGTIGLVDSMRIGPDFNHDGQGIRSGPLRGSRLYFLNGKVWWNDPDPSKVRTSNEGCVADPSINGSVTTAQARMTTSWVSLTDQFYLVSDWLPNLPQERLDILRKTMSPHDATARPVDYFDHELADTWLVSSDKSGVHRDVVGVFNFYGQPLEAKYDFAKVGLDPKTTYHAFDFWENRPVPDISGRLDEKLPPMSCRVLSLRATEGHPVLVSTSRHVSSGILEVTEEKWTGDTLAGTSDVIGADAYELRILGLRDGGKQWVPVEVSVSTEDVAVGVAVSHTVANGLLRVKIVAPLSRAVRWSVRFEAKDPGPRHLEGLKADAPSPYSPVVLSWKSDYAFHTVARDGEVIAKHCFGGTFADTGAVRGTTHSYTVAAEGGPAPLTVKVAVPAYPPAPPAATVKLGALKALEASCGWGSVRIGKSVTGGPLTVAGKVRTDGIGTHAASRVVYARDSRWKRFVAYIGLNEPMRGDGRTSIVCKVLSLDANGKESVLSASPPMRFGGVESFPVDVVLPAGCVKVALVTEDGGDGIACDHANWCDAGFLE